MMQRAITLCVMLSVCGLVSPDSFAQDSGRGGRRNRGNRVEREDRGNQASRRERGPRRGGFPGPSEMTDEERSAMYDRMVEHMQDRFADDYELTDEQSEQVKARLGQLKSEHEAYMKPLREESNRLRAELQTIFEAHRDGKELNRERMSEIFHRMHDMREGSPLMNRDRVVEQVESLLPAEQVEAGRARMERRHEEMRARWREGRDRSGQRGRFGQRGDEGTFSRGGRGDRWDRYCSDFKRRYELDASQAATADSVLRELKTQRDKYYATHQVEFDALDLIEDREERSTAYRDLREPVDDLFNRLRQRLGRIPTQTQKQAGGEMPDYWNQNRFDSMRRGATSRPAGARSRPARVSTRPSGG